MAEYIDRENYCENICRCSNEYCYRISCPIWKAPAADVAPVVRCEDCMFWVSGENECESWEYCKFLRRDMPPHAFCNFGERKEAQSDAKAD